MMDLSVAKLVGRLGLIASVVVAVLSLGNTLLSQQAEQAKVYDDRDKPLRVLLIAGNPSWEYRFLSKLLQRDKNISVSCWLQSLDESRDQEGDQVIRRLPRTAEELSRYDVIMMVDPRSVEFDAAWIRALSNCCEQRGVGLIYQAGPSNSVEFFSLKRLAKLKDLLRIDLTESFIESPPNPEPTSSQLVHDHEGQSFVDLDSDPDANRQVWERMPKINWHLPVQSTGLESFILQKAEGSERPLIVSRRPEDANERDGNIIFIAHNSTWQFRSTGKTGEYFDRFWKRAIEYAAGKSEPIKSKPVDEEWKWADEKASLLHYLRQSPRQYQVSLVRPQDNVFEVVMQIVRDEQVLHQWKSHYEGNFVISDSRVYYTEHSPSSSGCQLVAFDLDLGKAVWQVNLEGRGVVEHSKWRNQVNIEVRSDCVVVYGKESDGRYIEKVNLEFGEPIYHRRLERE